MNANLLISKPKPHVFAYILIALAVLMVINLTLNVSNAHPVRLLLPSQASHNLQGDAMPNPALQAPAPVPTPPSVQNRPIATPRPPKTSQLVPQFAPVPTPPLALVP